MESPFKYTDMELEYAATGRCVCGAGLAHPLDTPEALRINAWVCSKNLKGEVPQHLWGEHDVLPFSFYKVREESSINNRGGFTTRPPGTVAMTVGTATCPKCQHSWKSEPYSANGLNHHWFAGPCPECGYSVGGGSSYSSLDGAPIDSRFRTVVLAKE